MTALAIAHRAGNSPDALRRAVSLGADIIEADVQRYQGRLEVRHLKTMGPLPWLWDQWELRSARAPRLVLKDLLRAGDQDVTFMLDLKGTDPAVGVEVAEHLHEYAPSRAVLVCSRYWPALAPFASIPWARTVLSARKPAELAHLFQFLATSSGAGHHGASVHRSLLNAGVVASLHQHLELVMTWPVNDVSSLETVLRYQDSGTVGVISDELDVLARLLDARPR